MQPISTDNAGLYQRAKRLIPGGTQLLSKRPELYAPDCWPAYFREAKGCTIIDLDGRALVDMTTNSVGACLLGYANPVVNEAVSRRVQSGAMCTLNSPDEVELAELLVALHPWAGGVRYARTGGEAMAVAVRIVRAGSGRDRVACCGYHGWSDWYLAANLFSGRLDEHWMKGLRPAGVPRQLAGTAIPFRFNDLASLRQITQEYGSELAAIIMEPIRDLPPETGFLSGARELADECGAMLVFDEISSGWRFALGGAHLNYGVEPDVAVFAKAISNGFPMAAVIGRTSVMDAAQDTFISSTYWTDGVGPAAALATIAQMQQVKVPEHVALIGEQAMSGWKRLGAKHAVPVVVSGQPALAHLSFGEPHQRALCTLFTARMLELGFLAGSQFYPTLAHSEQTVDAFLAAADQVFVEIAAALRGGDIEARLDGPVRQTGFERLT